MPGRRRASGNCCCVDVQRVELHPELGACRNTPRDNASSLADVKSRVSDATITRDSHGHNNKINLSAVGNSHGVGTVGKQGRELADVNSGPRTAGRLHGKKLRAKVLVCPHAALRRFQISRARRGLSSWLPSRQRGGMSGWLCSGMPCGLSRGCRGLHRGLSAWPSARLR